MQLLNADKHSPASSVRSDCVHEQVAKPGPVSRAAGMQGWIADVRFTVNTVVPGLSMGAVAIRARQAVVLRDSGRKIAACFFTITHCLARCLRK